MFFRTKIVSIFTFPNLTIFIIVLDNDGSQRPANPTTRRKGYQVGEDDVYFINLP